jgi:hypothetical protein
MLGAFCMPEPLGACLLMVAVIWWLCRKLYAPILPSVAFDHERGTVSISGKRDSEGQRQLGRNIHYVRVSLRRDATPSMGPANCGDFASVQAISLFDRVRGGGPSLSLTSLRAKFPDIREKYREIRKISQSGRLG